MKHRLSIPLFLFLLFLLLITVFHIIGVHRGTFGGCIANKKPSACDQEAGALVTLIAAARYFYMREYWVLIGRTPSHVPVGQYAMLPRGDCR